MKKILFVDIITLFCGMLAVFLLCIFKITEISPLSITILIISLCAVLLSELFSLKIKGVKITNAVGTFAFFIVLIVLAFKIALARYSYFLLHQKVYCICLQS